MALRKNIYYCRPCCRRLHACCSTFHSWHVTFPARPAADNPGNEPRKYKPMLSSLAAERLRPRGYHRLLASFFPCNAHRFNVKISHSRDTVAPVPFMVEVESHPLALRFACTFCLRYRTSPSFLPCVVNFIVNGFVPSGILMWLRPV